MRKEALLATVLLALAQANVRAALVDPSLIPDGDYKVTIERVLDDKHILVRMENGIESRLSAAKTLTFDGAAASKAARIFIYKGTVITFKLT